MVTAAVQPVAGGVGRKWRQLRERLALRFRDVEAASIHLARKYHNPEHIVRISRLADIEQKDVMPGIHKIYSLCAIYRIDLNFALAWYGIDTTNLPVDSQFARIPRTHRISFDADDRGEVPLPVAILPGLDPSKTAFVSRLVRQWGKLPLLLLNAMDLATRRYGYIGMGDNRMHPFLRAGSFVTIDESARAILSAGWENEWERPIYFLEHREGYLCGWCNLTRNELIVSAPPASGYVPLSFEFPGDVDVVGTVSGVAMLLSSPAHAG